jgi:hypothetical protein
VCLKRTAAASATAGLICLMAVEVGTQSLSSTSQSPSARHWKMPRTPDGKPDLQGMWSYASPVPLEKPDPLNPTPEGQNEDAAEFDATVGNYNDFWFENAADKGDRRTSLIVDPADGRLPPLTPEAEKRTRALAQTRRGLAREEPTPGGWVEDLGPTQLKVRCILGLNSGPPLNPGGYNQHMQIFQAPGYAALFTEIIHNARIVPTDGRPHNAMPQWSGDARGRWEGETLVIDSIHFRGGSLVGLHQLSPEMHLVERLTRVAADTLMYEYTVDDPATWTRPWSVRIPLSKTDERIYEYACHEGNYALYNILAGARVKERAAEEGTKEKGK